ncbi:MAG: ATP-dependent DNA helicase RecG [Candidatus Nomurabacteria bacterium]|nr:MAG: ATP-dependent DNA helicase RecG [Candidatus Nomurabacteria bacterium]
MDLKTPLTQLRGVGPKIAQALQRLGIQNVRQLLQHYPFRYEDFSQVIPISRLQAGIAASVRVHVELLGARRSFRRRMSITEAAVKDESGYLKLVWFNQAYIAKSLENNEEIIVSGTPSLAKDGSLQMTNPSFEPVKDEQTHTGRIVPIYPVTDGLTPKYLRYLVQQALPCVEEIKDPLPTKIRQSEKLPKLETAVRDIHFPKTYAALRAARARLAFDELLRFQLHNQMHRAQLHHAAAPKIEFHEKATKDFVATLPFTLTNGQRNAAWEIIQSMNEAHPMNRLLQGDVGSGKTLVAILAALNTMWSKHQVAIMAPTEVLAEQHFQSIQKTLQDTSITIALLTGSQAKANRNDAIKKSQLKKEIGQGSIQLVIGTHALLVEDVQFQSLGLIIIDEQHRFGVAQRKLLKEKTGTALSTEPHFLSMTATPIPRTLALTLYSDLDISTITEMPKNRKPIRTHLIPEAKRKEMYGFIAQQIAQGRQAFVITALIDESDLLGVKAATHMAEELQKHVFPKLRVALLHGKLGSKEKEKIMRDFADHHYDILVATAVIEVGIDVPNASVMVIENAERFGLAQLHQFRGRVGRGDAQSYCFLLSQSETSGRLKKFAATRSGFAVAEEDLKRRGPGELRGGRQSGLPDFRMASLQDIELIAHTRDIAKELLQQDVNLEKWPGLLETIRHDAVHWE